MMPTAAAAAKARPWSRARKNAMGAEVRGRPTSQPPTAGPQRRPATLAVPMRTGVATTLRRRLSRRLLHGRDDDVGGLAREEILDVLHRAQEAVADDLGRLPRVVGREHHGVEAEDRVARLERLVVEDVEPGAGDLFRGQRVQQRFTLDQRAAPRVDEERRLLHQRQLLAAEEATRLRRQSQLQGDGIRGTEDLLLRPGVAR